MLLILCSVANKSHIVESMLKRNIFIILFVNIFKGYSNVKLVKSPGGQFEPLEPPRPEQISGPLTFTEAKQNASLNSLRRCGAQSFGLTAKTANCKLESLKYVK